MANVKTTLKRLCLASLFTVFGVCLLVPKVSYAQTWDSIISNYPALRVAEPLPDHRSKAFNDKKPQLWEDNKALFPNQLGLKPWLTKHGIHFAMQDINEYMGSVNTPTNGFRSPGKGQDWIGGRFKQQYKQGSSNSGNLSEALDIDWEKLAGIPGFATHVITVSRYGTTANRMMGDWLNHSSEDYGGGGNVAVHLVYAYGEETMFKKRLAIATGRMSEMSSFESSPLFCNFVNNGMCGRPKAATDGAYVTGYPAATWAGRIRIRPTTFTYFQFGAYAAEGGIYANAQHRTGFKFNSANIHGYRLPFETAWEPVFGGKLPGHYKIGATFQHAPIGEDSAGLPNFAHNPVAGKICSDHDQACLAGLPVKTTEDTYSTWFMADQKVMLHHHDKNRGLTLLTGFLYNDPRVSLRQWEAYGALIDRGIFKSRPYDAFGISFMYQAISHRVRNRERQFFEQYDVPGALGTSGSIPNHATGVQSWAAVLEVNYSISLGQGIIIEPDFQYFFQPNGQGSFTLPNGYHQKGLKNMAMIGCRTLVTIF